MRDISILILILYFITFTFSQTSDKYTVFYSSSPQTISVNFPNQTLPNAIHTVNCRIITFDNRFSYANFTVIEKSASSNSESFDVPISNLTIGRVQSFVCTLSRPGFVINVTKFLSVRPALSASVCENPSVVNGSSISFTVNFSAPLPNNGNLTCLGTPSLVTAGMTSKLLTIPYLPINNPSSCSLDVTSPPINISFNVTVNNQSIGFSPDVIESNSPVIKLNLISNYTIPSVNCIIALTKNVANCSITTQVNWTLSPNGVSFPVASSKLITMSRSGSISNFTENYYVVCCFNNSQISASVTIRNLTYEYTITSNASETNYGDLQFTRLSDCPCDLTVGICDQNCCCDSFCNCATDVNRFTGPYGGYFSDPLPRSCNYQDDLTRQPYQSLLCVANESPNIIGDYYSMQSIVNDFTTTFSSNRNSGFQIKTDVSSPIQSTSMLISISTNPISTILTSKYLYLPRQVIDSSKCDLQNQIVMLQPYDSICSYSVTNANCNSMADPRLSSFFYLQSTTSMETNCNNKMGIKDISNIPVFTFYNCIPSGTCSWTDNGYNLPPSPSIDLNSTQCMNVVTSVSYVIYYNAIGAAYINANISIGDVSINRVLDQKFTVSFVSTDSTKETANNQSFTYLQSILKSTVVSISGRYGYDDGMPIIAAYNNSSPNNTTYFKTLPTSVSGNCDNKIGNNVLFRQDSLVQCKYDISNKNCSNNRNGMKNYLDSLVNFNYVAIYGNQTTSNDFILINKTQIIITEFTNPYYPTNQNANLKNPINDMTGYCANVTTGLTITIYYSRQGKARGQYINNIVSVVQRYQYSNISFYSPVGSNDTVSNSIMLTVYHSFVLVSSNIAGTQNTDNNAQAVCLFDICINELFYPWMYNYEGKQGFYEESFGLFLLGLAIFLLVTTYPWW